MKLCLPILGVALVVGLLISFIQAITQINEATLAFLPKFLAIGLALIVMIGGAGKASIDAVLTSKFEAKS